MEEYILIHGSLEKIEAQRNMELFDAKSNEIITDTIPWNIDTLNVDSYSWCIDGDLFVISGGNYINTTITSDTIQFINATKILTEPPNNDTFTWIDPCVTKYDGFVTGNVYDGVPLDDYLLQQRALRFEVTDEGRFSIYISGNGDTYAINFGIEKSTWLNDTYTIFYEASNSDFRVALNMFAGFKEVYDLTNIDMTNNSYLIHITCVVVLRVQSCFVKKENAYCQVLRVQSILQCHIITITVMIITFSQTLYNTFKLY